MKTTTRRRIAQHIIDLDFGITKGFNAADVDATIRSMETRASQPLDEMVNSGSKDYSTLLLAACRYTAAIKGQQAAATELGAATQHLIALPQTAVFPSLASVS
tara:strand:- start:567 stop:875 length:309 start_codon:yes stop_codon:yes gene_type:complete